jgi:SH3-like domain-containing protein
MNDHEWPDRLHWQDNAEPDTRQACYPQQRVSDQLAHWMTPSERTQMAHVARLARTDLSRLIRVLEDAETWTRIDDAQGNLSHVHRLMREWTKVENEVMEAAAAATDAAVNAEIERRKTDAAWTAELQRRAVLDAGRSR